jgi:hypothetical protein
LSEESTKQLTPLDKDSPRKNEFEVWANREVVPPRLLLVMLADDEVLRIIDPAANAEVFSANHYLYVVDYLREEDYRRVNGRMDLVLPDDDDDDD